MIMIIFLVVNIYCALAREVFLFVILIFVIPRSSCRYSYFINKESEVQIKVKWVSQGHMAGRWQNELKANSFYSKTCFILCFVFVLVCLLSEGCADFPVPFEGVCSYVSQIPSGLKLWLWIQGQFSFFYSNSALGTDYWSQNIKGQLQKLQKSQLS